MKSSGLLCLAFVLFLSCRDVAGIDQRSSVLTTVFTIQENRTEDEEVGRLAPQNSGGAEFRFITEESSFCNNFFTLHENTSIIRTVGLLDREAIYREIETDVVQCFVSYFNTSVGRREPNIRITIHVLDINDEVPQFNNLAQPHVVQVVENVAAPTPLLRLEPVDNDNGANGTVEFNITSGDTDYFMIMKAEGDTSNSPTRLLFLRRELDFERHDRMFNLTITISDKGSPVSRTFDQKVVIVVNNSLDEPPTFPMTSFQFTVPENQPVGINHPFANVTAANSHEVLGSIFYYVCEESGCERTGPAGVILVNEVTGGLYLNRSLDYDDFTTVLEYSFYIKASSPASGTSQTAFIRVAVEDVNDVTPYFTCVNDTTSSIKCPNIPSDAKFKYMDYEILEDSESSTRRSLRLMAHDTDREPVFSNFVLSVNSEPSIDISYIDFANGLVIVFTDEKFDHERTPSVTISVTISNTASPYLSSTAVIQVHVKDLNDNAPIFKQAQYDTYVSEGSPIGRELITVEATDSDSDENGRVTYSITDVDKAAAWNWFEISNATGVLTVVANDIDFRAVEGVVLLNITATDNGDEPLSSFTLVEVNVVPAITFSARSYQTFANYNLATVATEASVYLEFQTSSADGVLLHHQEAGSYFTLGLEEGKVTLRQQGAQVLSNDAAVLDYTWYSVLVERIEENFHLEVWRTGTRHAQAVLLEAQIQNCTNGTEEEELNLEQLLYVGGINPLLSTSGESAQFGLTSDFIGAIRNIIIDQSQLNSKCPQKDENTFIGVERSNQCGDEELRCHPLYSTGCVDYAVESFCKCRGGFDSKICSANFEEDNYAPIRLHGYGPATMDLPDAFFYDLEMFKRSGEGNMEETVGPGTTTKKRRQVDDQISSLQKVEVRFRPVEVGATVLLHSESQDYVHQLKIKETGTEYAVAYLVFDKTISMDDPRDQLLINNLELQNGTEYHITITYNNHETRMSLSYDMRVQYNTYDWGSNPITLFAEQLGTQLSIGGASGEKDFFVGCVSSLKINEIEVPLSGLASLPEEQGGFSYSSTGAVEPYCNLCDLTTCPGNRVCVSDLYSGTVCACPAGHILDEIKDSCILPEPPTGNGLATGAASGQMIYYIAGGTGGGVLVVAILILVIILAIKVKHVRYGKKKRTYSVNRDDNGILPSQRTSKSGNEYVRVQPKITSNDEDILTCIGTRTDSRERGSSISTFQEHADDGDPEIDEPPRLQRRKSTVSAESGIRTDTERDSSLRGTSRMDDSGTDYTPQESESDDVISSCFMEPVSSPVGIHLVGSASSVMGVPIKVASPVVPLTPQERKAMTPLRPDSIRLSMSEDDHHDTDFDTDISSCNLPPMHQNCPMQRESDSDTSTKVSDRSTPKWYKSSTASDNERESERALKNRAYYPTRSESMHYPHPPRPKTAFGGPAPDYVPPPTISARKSASPVFPRSPSRRLPPTMMSADSPLTRNTRKYENYPLPYSHRPSPPPSSDVMRDRHNRGVTANYENHSVFQHQISAPQPRDAEHHIGQQGRHVYFAKSSQTLHYCNSIGRERYSPPKHQQEPPHTSSSSRQYYTLASAIPSSLQYRQNRSFSSGDTPPSDREEQTQFQDLKNVSTINPISYWEMQDRLKPAVDQVDPYQVLSEPYIQFEDVSTDLSVTESQATLNADEGPDHEVFESQGGGEGTADIGPLDGCLRRLQDHDISSVTSDSQSSRVGITHFPSADCSKEYSATINGTSSSGDSTPKFQQTNGFIFPSQQSFDV